MEATKLLPCPFCGRAPVIKHVPFSRDVLAQAPDPDSYWWIGCEIDANITGCGIGHSNIDKADAVEKWNTRARSAAFDALLQAARATERLFREALPKFNWGASALDANAIALLNEVPSQVSAAITSAEKAATEKGER